MHINPRTAAMSGIGDFIMFKPGVYTAASYMGPTLDPNNAEPTLTPGDVNLPAQAPPGFYPPPASWNGHTNIVGHVAGPDGTCRPCVTIVPGASGGCCPGNITYQDNIDPWMGNAITTADQISLDPLWAIDPVVPSATSISDPTWTIDELINNEQAEAAAEYTAVQTGVPLYVSEQGQLLGMGAVGEPTKDKKIALTRAVDFVEEQTKIAVATNQKAAAPSLKGQISNLRTEITKAGWTDSSGIPGVFTGKYQTSAELRARLNASQNLLIRLDNPTAITSSAIDASGRPIVDSPTAAYAKEYVTVAVDTWIDRGSRASAAGSRAIDAGVTLLEKTSKAAANLDTAEGLLMAALAVAAVGAAIYAGSKVYSAYKAVRS